MGKKSLWRASESFCVSAEKIPVNALEATAQSCILGRAFSWGFDTDLQNPCAPASALLNFAQMRSLTHLKFSLLKPALAGLLASLMFLMTVATSSHWLHDHFHASPDTNHEQSPCAVCTIAQGQLDAPIVEVSEVFVSLSVTWTVPSLQSSPLSAIELSVAPTRGPPASVSSQS